jgi:hypothetical protein
VKFGETPETYFAGTITEKRHNFDPSTPPAGAENLHFMLNGEIWRAPGPPVTGAQTAWEDADQVSFAVLWYSHRQAWARAVYPPGQTDLHPGKKEKVSKKQ